MDDDFLMEQIERMRRLTERMAQVHSRVAQDCELISRDREALYSGPLHEVRDLRTHETHRYSEVPDQARLSMRSPRAESQPAKSRRRRR
jgi:hypothetical protein